MAKSSCLLQIEVSLVMPPYEVRSSLLAPRSLLAVLSATCSSGSSCLRGSLARSSRTCTKTKQANDRSGEAPAFERGEKTPTPKISALLRKRPVLLRTNFVLTKDRKRPYYGHFCGKMHREGSCSKAAGGP